MVTDRPPTTRKNRSRSRWALATAATTLLVVSASPLTAFQSLAPLHRQRTNGLRRSTRQWTVTDPDILLREKVPRLSIDMAALEKAYSSSSDMEERPFFDDRETALPERKRKKATTKKSTSRRSSTMPGFASRSTLGTQKAFRDGIKIAEQRSGKKYVDTPDAQKQRRKQSNEAMYKTTASVPDSLVHFANEIHLVSDLRGEKEGWSKGFFR